MDTSIIDIVLFVFFSFIALIVILFIGGFGVLLIYGLKKREKRLADLKELSAKIGWNYQAKADPSLIPRHLIDPKNIHTYSSVSNYLNGNIDGLSAIAFDYTYKIGHSKNTTMSSYTLFALHAPHLVLPKFALCEESFFNKMSWAISNRKDLNFPAYPHFSARFLLDAENEAAVYQTFNPKVISFYEQNATFQTLSDGNVLMIAPNRNLVEAADFENWINLLRTLHEVFRASKNS